MLYINWNLSISVTFLFQNREKCGHVHNNLTVVLDHSFSHPLWCESGINLVCDIFCWYWTWQRMFSQLFNMWTCKNLKYIFDEQTWRIYSYHCLNCDCSNVCSAIGWKQMSTGTRPILITTNPGFGRVFGLQLGYGIVQTSLLEAFKKTNKKKKTKVKQRGPESVNRWDDAWWQSSYRLDTGTTEPAWFLCHFCRQRPPSDTGSGRAAHLTHKQDPHRNRNPCSTCSAQTAPPPDSQTHCCTGSPAQNLQKQNFSLDSWKWGLSTLLGALHMFLTYPLIGWTFHLIARRSITQLPCKWTALTNIVEPGSLESCTTSTDPHEHVHTSTHMKQWSSPLVGHKKNCLTP